MMRGLLGLVSVLWMGAIAARAAEPVRCEEGQIRRIAGKRKVVEKVSYCYNYDRTYLVSRSCAVPRSKCKARDTSSARKVLKALSPKDKTPGFTLCRKLGGRPEVVEFNSDGVWYELDRCFFPEDASFMDTASLFARQRHSLVKAKD